MENIILQNISHSYGENNVLDQINLTIHQGEFFTLLGPSGCGKTTLLRILAGFIHPTSGKIFIDNQDITDLSPEKRGMGIVFQNYALFPNMTVEENIAYGLQVQRRSKQEIKEKCNYYLQLTNLEELRSRKIDQLSGGQQQRVAIARAVVANPKLILADEPTGNLDSKNGKEVMGLLSELNKEGTTIVMVTHSQHDAGYADRIINLFDGQVVTEVSM